MMMTGYGVHQNICPNSSNPEKNAINFSTSMDIFDCEGVNGLEFYATGA